MTVASRQRHLRLLLLATLLAACERAGTKSTAAASDSSMTGSTGSTDSTGSTAAVTAVPDAGCPSPRAGVTLRDDTTVTEILVSPGDRGMITRLRWTASPDGCALLVVEDPSGVETEPIPDRFVYVAEPARAAGVPLVLAQDSVWDVSPGPRWQRLAFGRAYVAMSRGGDSLAAAQWSRMARDADTSERAVRAAAFASSAMTIAHAVARAVVADVAEPAASNARPGMGTTRPLPALAGWTVQWSADGAHLFLGASPRGADDDAPPTRWVRVDAATGATLDSAASAPADTGTVAWTEGPMLEHGTRTPIAAPRTVRTASGVVESRDGRITLTFGDGSRRAVGAGAALAATAGGRFVLALRTARAATEVVIYQLHY